MTYIGQKFAVGSKIEEAGVYEHTAWKCDKQHTFSDVGDPFPPCSDPDCTNKGADWELIEKTGTT